MNTSIYQGIYDLIKTYIFGGVADAGSFQEMFCVLVAGSACFFVMALPFILVWRVILLLSGR